jgi:hypothetical protein
MHLFLPYREHRPVVIFAIMGELVCHLHKERLIVEIVLAVTLEHATAASFIRSDVFRRFLEILGIIISEYMPACL